MSSVSSSKGTNARVSKAKWTKAEAYDLRRLYCQTILEPQDIAYHLQKLHPRPRPFTESHVRDFLSVLHITQKLPRHWGSDQTEHLKNLYNERNDDNRQLWKIVDIAKSLQNRWMDPLYDKAAIEEMITFLLRRGELRSPPMKYQPPDPTVPHYWKAEWWDFLKDLPGVDSSITIDRCQELVPLMEDKFPFYQFSGEAILRGVGFIIGENERFEYFNFRNYHKEE